MCGEVEARAGHRYRREGPVPRAPKKLGPHNYVVMVGIRNSPLIFNFIFTYMGPQF